MSIKLMQAAWETDCKGNDLLVLISLADNASEEGYCWPSWDSIIAKTKVSKGTLSKVLNKLEKDGIIIRESRKRDNGSSASNGYFIFPNMGRSSETEHHSGVQKLNTEKGGGVQKLNYRSSETEHLEPPKEPSIKKLNKKRSTSSSKFLTGDPLIDEFINHRSSIKKPMTEKAVILFAKNIEALRAEYDVQALVENAIMSGWQMIYPKDEFRLSQASAAAGGWTE